MADSDPIEKTLFIEYTSTIPFHVNNTKIIFL